MTVTLFTLGGTIAMAGTRRSTALDPNPNPNPNPQETPVVTRLTGADLTAAVPGLDDLGVPLDVRDALAVPSANLTFRDLYALVDEAAKAVAEGARGIVVTQGTDTLEETAFLVDLLWPHPEPFVFTGAMRNPTLAGADGPANLLAAARVAASPEARDLGALAVLDDQIHAARWVRKTHATRTSAFASPDTGPLGHVIEGEVHILTRPPRHPPLRLTTPPTPARVALYPVTLDDDGTLLAGLADTQQGLIVAGFGVGHVPSALAPILGDLANHIPVVLCSRTGAGPVLRHTYGAIGSETDLLRRGLLHGGLLDPYKARVLLRVLLARGVGREEIAAEFGRRASMG